MLTVNDSPRPVLVRRGFVLEYLTLGWNAVGIVILAVIWELSGTGEDRQRRGLRVIGYAFTALALYLLIRSTLVLVAGYHPQHSLLGVAWTAVTALAMFAFTAGKARTGRELGNPVLRTEGRVTTIDGILACAVLLGLVLNAAVSWWWTDPLRSSGWTP